MFDSESHKPVIVQWNEIPLENNIKCTNNPPSVCFVDKKNVRLPCRVNTRTNTHTLHYCTHSSDARSVDEHRNDHHYNICRVRYFLWTPACRRRIWMNCARWFWCSQHLHLFCHMHENVSEKTRMRILAIGQYIMTVWTCLYVQEV